ncbi:MAG: multiheme c-type cytochrome [Kofleriaceae bacterium]
MTRLLAIVIVLVAACSGGDTPTRAREVPAAATTPSIVMHEARLPRAPGVHGPSLVEITGPKTAALDEPSTGSQMADVDSCATCHPDVAAQWGSSAHSFASFGNPSYRANIEKLRADLGKPASLHCAGCHDMPLLADGLMVSDAPDAIDGKDLRAHSGVTCRLCHGIQSTTLDGNGSYVWNATPIEAPSLDDAPSIARHKAQVTTKVDNEMCMGCHRGFLGPDMGLPAHLTGVDEVAWWMSSPYNGAGMARLDDVEKQTCIDCHMERTPASKDELGAKHGSVASHRFVGGHTWMASMRDDKEQMALTRAKLEGVASIDVRAHTAIERGKHAEVDVVLRNLLAGHRFPGGVLDVQDTWVELEVADRNGVRIGSSGLAHEKDPNDQETHVLRTLQMAEDGRVLEEHEVGSFRSTLITHTLAPREARAVRYSFDVPKNAALPLVATARLRHRSRTLQMQAAACAAAKTPEGKVFIDGARGARDVTLDPCKPQPITLVSSTRTELGDTRPAWKRDYEHGMALVSSIITKIDDAKAPLQRALAAAPGAREKAMVETQLGWVAAKQGRTDDVRAHIARVRELLALSEGQPGPAVLDAIAAEVHVKLASYDEAIAPAEACTKSVPQNVAAWQLYARVLVGVGRFEDALAAAVKGLALNPRDPSLLMSQATALAALKDPKAAAAQDAFTRFKFHDEAAGLRIRCIKGSDRCRRDRNQVQTIALGR